MQDEDISPSRIFSQVRANGCASTEVTPDQIMRPLGLLQGCGQTLSLAKARTYGLYTASFLVLGESAGLPCRNAILLQ